MKLLPESSGFETINSALNIEAVDASIMGRLESYSCKMVGQEKALYKRFHSFSGLSDMQALSPPQSMMEASSPHSHAKYVWVKPLSHIQDSHYNSVKNSSHSFVVCCGEPMVVGHYGIVPNFFVHLKNCGAWQLHIQPIIALSWHCCDSHKCALTSSWLSLAHNDSIIMKNCESIMVKLWLSSLHHDKLDSVSQQS